MSYMIVASCQQPPAGRRAARSDCQSRDSDKHHVDCDWPPTPEAMTTLGPSLSGKLSKVIGVASRSSSILPPLSTCIPLPVFSKESLLPPERVCLVFYLTYSHSHLYLSILSIMAIHPTSSAPQSPHPASQAHPIDIEAWTEQATAAMGSVTISSDPVPGTTVSLHIPLDEHVAPRPIGTTTMREGYHYKRKEPLRRDSMKRREALAKGNEGSRRRQRWENGKPCASTSA